MMQQILRGPGARHRAAHGSEPRSAKVRLQSSSPRTRSRMFQTMFNSVSDYRSYALGGVDFAAEMAALSEALRRLLAWILGRAVAARA